MSAHRIVLYGKPGCHLCEEALTLLHGLQNEFALTIQEVDITTDANVFKQYFEKIPVLLIDERALLAAPIQVAQVRVALNASIAP